MRLIWRIIDKLSYPRKGFELILWAIIAVWVSLGIGVTYHLWYWNMDMTEKRVELQQRIQTLQDYIKNNNIGRTFD